MAPVCTLFIRTRIRHTYHVKPSFPKKHSRSTSPRRSSASFSDPLKIKLAGKDDAPLSMSQLRDGLYETVRRLLPYDKHYRVKRAAIYLTVIDENGQPVQLSPSGEWTIYPYLCAAEDFDT
jgi:hypothetical protein